MKETILDIENLSVIIKERYLVKNVSLTVDEGEAIALVGSDGSGKTSLLKTITHSLPITEGNIFVCGRNVTEKESYSNVGISLDPPVFFKFQTVFNNLAYLTKISGNFDKIGILDALKAVGLERRAKVLVLFLSYAEKKLMSLALAFLAKPKLLLLDEPFKSLSKKQCEIVKSQIKKLQEQGTAVVISTCTLEDVSDICSKYYFMENRQITKIVENTDVVEYLTDKEMAFVEVKYPHYVGKMIIESFNLHVKLLGNKVVFDTDEDTLAKIVIELSGSKITVFKAGYLNSYAEKVLASLTPYFKEAK